MTHPTRAATAGTLDPSFASGGILKFPIPEISGFHTVAVLELPERKLLVAIHLSGVNAPTAIARLNEDGSLDIDFGGNGSGLVEIYIEGAQLDVRELCRLSDGGWLVMGQYTTIADGGLYVVRHREDGQLDESFGEKGVRLLPYGSMGNPKYVGVGRRVPGWDNEESSAGAPWGSGSKGASAVQQLDGKIFLAGGVSTESGQTKGIVLRLNSDGSTDYTFNGLGFAIVELEGIAYDENYTKTVAVQADGKVLVCGDYRLRSPDSRGVYVTRFDEMGRLDRSFNGGTVTVRSSNSIYMEAIEVREIDGSIVAIGEALRDGIYNGLMFVLTSGGFFDFNFNRGQPLFSTLVPQGLKWRRCALQADGSIIVAGTTGRGFATEEATALTARFRSDGSLDQTFNGTGFIVFDEDETYESLEDMTIMKDGRIVVCGLTWVEAKPWAYAAGGWVIRYLA
ncbi:hypothetical protein [Pseudomonas viciae]|uniref:hypothetical protein n=1 Tax=Pseudomonas viciae TaxID=2505979 RepID=UPI002234D62E|nr:hypothetical protein [Pseudomonas viciae]UZE86363.1 hypothetical protein LOY66_28220 [Pseudomonas viciae]